MSRPTKSYRHSDTAYNRPNQSFVCGHQCDGKSCALGPDAKGRCRGDFVTDDNRRAGECIPAKGQYNRVTGETSNRERWFCGRDPSCGGPCEDGPLPDGSCCLQLTPCSPAQSLRRKRGIATFLVASLTIGLVLILFAREPESLDHPLNPGPVSSAHSTAGTTCASCHDSVGGPLEALTDFHSDRAFLDAHRCADCHHEIGGEDRVELFTAHTLPAAHLAKLSAKNARDHKSGARPMLVGLASAIAVDSSEIACASCHKEHHGTKADLKHMSDSQCQVCHTEQFHSFSEGHPEFTSYPYRRRTRIFFDHETHFSEYFKTEEFKQYAKNSCADCHTEQPGGGMMLTDSFANTCAECHDSNTKFGSWEIMAFPKVDTRRLEDQLTPELAEKLAPWESANAREISPLLKILLSGEEVESLYPLRKASDEQKEAAAAFSKLLVEEIYSDSEPEKFEERLAASDLLEGVDPADAQRLGKNLAAVFTNLRAAAGTEDPVVSSTDSGGAFTYDPLEGALSYQPSGHADPVMKAILDVAAAKVGKVDNAEELLGYASDFWQGAETTAAGKCIKCHTLDRVADGSMRINWYPAPTDMAERPITKFKHRSHVRLPELVGKDQLETEETCASCHQVDTSEDHVKKYRGIFSAENQNPHHFYSGFKHLMLNNCATCHTEDHAGDSCLLCHQYHATPSPLTPALGSLVSFKKGTEESEADSESETPPEGDGGSLLPGGDEEGGTLLPGGDDDEGGSLLPGGDDDEGGTLLPGGDDEGGSLLPGGDDEGGSLLPGGDDDEGGSLLPGGDDEGGSLLPGGDDEGGSLLPGGDDEGDSLLPDDDGESLIPTEDPDEEESLLPGGEESESGESLIPEEEESLLPTEDES